MRPDQLFERADRAREDAPPAGPRPDAPQVANVALGRLEAHPRKLRDDLGDLTELTGSIRTQGVLVPLLVERRGDRLLIVHGHRRVAAAICAGLRKAPCLLIAEQSDVDAIVAMLATKEHRRHLTPGERQRAVAGLRHEFALPMPEIARRLGISESSAHRWGQGEDAATVRGDRPPPRADRAKSWGGQRLTRKPRIRADQVWSLVQRWREQVADGLNEDQAQALLAEVEDLVQEWSPEPTGREQRRAVS